MNRAAEIAQADGTTGYRVDDLIIDIGRHRVTRGDTEIPLPALSFDLLLALLKAAPNLLTYDQLMQRVWPGVVVNQETVSQRVKLVRDALGDVADNPRYLVGVRGRGYRVLPAVQALPIPVQLTPAPVDMAATLSVRDRLPARIRGRRWMAAALAFAGALLIAGIVIALTQWGSPDAGVSSHATVTPSRTIAVLPFVNMSSDPEDEYFSDGLSEELLNRLTVIPELHVAARTSSFHFKGKSEDVKEIGQTLGVRHVLEGSVRRQGDRVRINVQLVSTEDGYRLWSNTFDRQVADVFAIQDEIALAIAEQLKLTLVAGEKAATAHHLTSNAEALDLYLRGRHLYQSWQLDRIEKSIEYFKEAIRIDPGFTAAYVAQAEAVMARGIVGTECCEIDSPLRRARGELLQRALEIDPQNAGAIASIGLDLAGSWDFAGAERELLRAEQISPNSEIVLRSLVWYYISAGWPPEKSIDYAQRLFRLDPLNPFAALVVAQAYSATYGFEQSLIAADRAIELDPNYWPGHTFRAAALMDLDRFDEAVAPARRALELSGDNTERYMDVIWAYAGAGRMVEAQKLFDQIEGPNRQARLRPTVRAVTLAALGKHDEALAGLEQAYRVHDEALPSYITLKLFIPLHDDARFRELIRLLKLERRIEYTREMSAARQRVALKG